MRCGDALELLKEVPANSVDSLLTDPPAGVDFMHQSWDCFRCAKNPSDASRPNLFGRFSTHYPHSYGESDRGRFIGWLTEIMHEVYRTLKPGAHGLVWALPRTSHWTGTALADAGFEIRDIIHHLFATGGAKGLNLKEEWEGWSTALAPSTEHWLLIRKPLSAATIAANMGRWGTGALNINATRTRRASTDVPGWHKTGADGSSGFQGTDTFKIRPMSAEEIQERCGNKGRWPKDVVFSHDPRCMIVGAERVKGCPAEVIQGGKDGGGYDVGSSDGTRHTKFEGYGDADGLETIDVWACVPGCPIRQLDNSGPKSISRKGKPRASSAPGPGWGLKTGAEYADRGGPSRYFPTFHDLIPTLWKYVPKPSRAEKEAGLDALPDRTLHRLNPGGLANEERWAPVTRKNHHATVKSIQLARWMARLITPPAGLILDPFAGSASLGCGALLEGFHYLGIESDPEFVEIAQARLTHWEMVE